LNGDTRSTVIHTGGQLNNAAEFNNQIVTYQNGSPVRLKDVAQVIDGMENPYGKSWYQNREAITLAIFRQPGSNVVQVTDTIKKILPQFQANLPPAVRLDVVFDRSQMIRASIDDVQHTLLIAGALVVGVIFRLPAACLRHHHPLAGAAHRHHRHLRRHGGLRVQPRQSVPDGADPVGRLCGR
jgi:HAE1 family hydrophobic/amphiphilic exporter-1